MPQVLVVGAVIVDDLTRPTRVLAARRTAPPALAGQWELPGGKVEPGESPEAALHREIAEELGTGIVLGDELRPPAGQAWPLTERLVMRTWWCTLRGNPVTGPDHDELRWVGADDVEDLPWLPADRPIVARIRRHLGAP